MRPLVAIALIGCGRIAQVAHLPALAKAAGVQLAAVCDASRTVAEAVAQRYGVASVHTDVEKILCDPAIEALLIAVPDRLHLSIALAGLEAGKHVLVEKPLATTVADCRRLAAAAERTGLRLQVGAMKRHDPGIEFARRFIGERLGRVHTFSAWYRISTLRPAVEAELFPAFAHDDDQDRDPEYKADRERYYLATHGSHLFDGLRHLVGEPSRIVAQLSRCEEDLSWRGLWSLAGGGLGSFELTVNVHAPAGEGYDVFGTGGAVRVDTHFPFYRRASEVRAFDARTQEWCQPELGAADAYRRQLEAFARSIRLGEPTSPDASDGLAAVRLIERVARSVHTGAAVDS